VTPVHGQSPAQDRRDRDRSGRDRSGRWLTLAGLAGTLAASCSVGLLATSAWLISRAAQRPPVLYLMVAAAAVQAFGLGRAVFRYAERLAGHDAALRILAGIRVTAYARLERLAPAGLAAFRSGDLVARLVGDVDSLADRWLRVRLPYAVALAAGALAVAVSAVLLPGAGLVLAVSLLAAAVAAPVVAIGAARHAGQQVTRRRGELAAATADLLRGIGELAVFGNPAAAVESAGARGGGGSRPARSLPAGASLAQVTSADRELTRIQTRSAAARGIGAAVTVLAAGAALWGALLLGVPAVRSGALAGVTLAVVVLLPLAAHEVFSGLAPAAQEIPRLRSAAARVTAVMTRPDPVSEPAVPEPLPAPPYDIQISGLAARYHPDGPDVLHELDLEIPYGQRVAVTGPSGSGKTTLAMVLLRFLDPAAGTVTLGGTDITRLDGDEVRAVVGLCAQDAHVFDTTLAANLRIARAGASDAELRDALRRARLLDWAESQAGGLDTPVGQHGTRLSGGQRQRLALARVLLADFPVVIFDEPTEHIDQQTAAELTADLLAAGSGKTVILITHRPVGAADVDQLLRMEHGRRAAAPADLADRPGSGRAAS
jgi:ABC-type transport system involved in cytochrome bd biosynthesis fused ATPase/permease subunit